MKRFFYRLVLCVVLLMGAADDAAAQVDTTEVQDRDVWQLSGLVVNKETLEPIPYARAGVVHTRRSTTANEQGFYSLPVTLSDTLYFFALGYKPSFMSVKDYLSQYEGDAGSGYIYAINYLTEDSINLQTVNIWPWDTPTELRTALLEARSPHETEMAYARDNLDPKLMDELVQGLSADTDERLIAARAAYYNQYMTAHVAPTASLLNPIAIFSLLKYINDKTKEKKRNQNLNSWEE